jgi:prepilin-type processing-associated H-X9-DG protein
VLNRAKQAGQSTQCLNNIRQLQMAFHLYTEDYNGWFPYHNEKYVASADAYVVANYPAWVQGYLNYKPENGFNTNSALLLAEGTLGAFLNNATVFRCPSDKSYVASPAGRFNRIRSFSMNTAIGIRNGSLANQFFQKYENIRQPSRIFVLAEEHEDSIDDGNMLVPVRNRWGYHNGAFPNLVASRHGERCSFSFADGHVESKKWIDPRTTVEPQRKKWGMEYAIGMADSPDVGWVADHALEYQ